MGTSSVAGTIHLVQRRGKNTYCFDGADLHKIGRGVNTFVEHAGTLYTGELIAISPARAILLVASHCPEHGVRSIAQTLATSA